MFQFSKKRDVISVQALCFTPWEVFNFPVQQLLIDRIRSVVRKVAIYLQCVEMNRKTKGKIIKKKFIKCVSVSINLSVYFWCRLWSMAWVHNERSMTKFVLRNCQLLKFIHSFSTTGKWNIVYDGDSERLSLTAIWWMNEKRIQRNWTLGETWNFKCKKRIETIWRDREFPLQKELIDQVAQSICDQL